jgi:hypothetical protein
VARVGDSVPRSAPPLSGSDSDSDSNRRTLVARAGASAEAGRGRRPGLVPVHRAVRNARPDGQTTAAGRRGELRRADDRRRLTSAETRRGARDVRGVGQSALRMASRNETEGTAEGAAKEGSFAMAEAQLQMEDGGCSYRGAGCY